MIRLPNAKETAQIGQAMADGFAAGFADSIVDASTYSARFIHQEIDFEQRVMDLYAITQTDQTLDQVLTKARMLRNEFGHDRAMQVLQQMYDDAAAGRWP